MLSAVFVHLWILTIYDLWLDYEIDLWLVYEFDLWLVYEIDLWLVGIFRNLHFPFKTFIFLSPQFHSLVNLLEKVSMFRKIHFYLFLNFSDRC